MADEAARLFVTLYTDADIHGGLAAQIRRHGFDAMSAYETGNAELNDIEQLAYAASQGRTILTCNSKDFEPLYEAWWRAERKHSGIVVSEQLPIGEMLRRVLRLLNTVTSDELMNGYRNLAEFAERT